MSRPYEIAISSFRREERLRYQTLAYLQRAGIPRELITVFVANEEEWKRYEATLDPNTYGKMVLGVEGLVPARNFARLHYPEGTRLVMLDDDIQTMLEKRDDKTLVENTDFDAIIRTGFSLCEQVGSGIWGVYAVQNALFMKHRVYTELAYIVGVVYGVINSHEPLLLSKPECPIKEDYERSLAFYKKHGVLVRMDWLCPKTKYYDDKGSGGITASGVRSPESVEAAIQYLEREYPGWVKRRNKKVSRYPEILISHRKQRTLA